MRSSVSKLPIIAFILLLLPSAAMAQIPTRGNLFVGYSYGSADFFVERAHQPERLERVLGRQGLALGRIRG